MVIFGKKSAVSYKHVQFAIIKFFSRKCYYFNCKFYNVVRDSPSQVSNSKKFVRILSELNYEIYLFKLSFRNVLFEVYASIRVEEMTKYKLLVINVLMFVGKRKATGDVTVAG